MFSTHILPWSACKPVVRADRAAFRLRGHIPDSVILGVDDYTPELAHRICDMMRSYNLLGYADAEAVAELAAASDEVGSEPPSDDEVADE